MKLVSQIEALKYIKEGKVVIFPTETSYGLGCDATNQEAVDKIFKIKNRRSDKPLLVVVPTVEMAKEYLEWNELLDNIAKEYWPGAVTVVGKCRLQTAECRMVSPLAEGWLAEALAEDEMGCVGHLKLADGVLSKDNTIAVRVTNSEIPKYLSQSLGRPVVATSANLADIGDIYDTKELIKMYEGKEFQPDAIIDAGVLPHNPPTTIVSVVGGELKVLRQGALKLI